LSAGRSGSLPNLGLAHSGKVEGRRVRSDADARHVGRGWEAAFEGGSSGLDDLNTSRRLLPVMGDSEAEPAFETLALERVWQKPAPLKGGSGFFLARVAAGVAARVGRGRYDRPP